MGKRKEVDIRAVVRDYIAKEYGTQRAAAEAWGCKQPFISAVLNGSKMMPEWMANHAGYMLVNREAEWVRLKK